MIGIVVEHEQGSQAMTVRSKGNPELVRGLARQERERVEALLRRDSVEAGKEEARRQAEIEVSDGVFVNLSDTVVEPTPEWLEKGDVASFTPKQPDGTVRTIRTVRRMSNALVIRLHAKGRLTDDQLAVCLWYRDRFEVAGLEGRWSTSRFSNTPGGNSGTGAAPMAMHEHEAAARAEYRAARDAITPFYRKFFEKVVLEDLPLARAARFARCRQERAVIRLRSCIQELLYHCEAHKISVGETRRA